MAVEIHLHSPFIITLLSLNEQLVDILKLFVALLLTVLFTIVVFPPTVNGI